MTDDFDRAIRDADPYRPGVSDGLGTAAQDLLEDIVSITETPARRRLYIPLVGTGVAAAVIAGVFALSTPDATPPDRAPVTSSSSSAVTYSALALKAAEQNPRLLIDEPGWTVNYLVGFADKTGSIRWARNGVEVEINWRPAEYYESYHADRLDAGKSEPVTMAGRKGVLFTNSPTDYGVMLPPSGANFVELQTTGQWTRARFDEVVSHVVQVDVQQWLAALPPEIVTPDRIRERADEVLAGVPLPPGFDKASLADLGTNDAYQFGAQVAGRVGCGWIAEWERATKAGDAAAVKRAAAALRSSHGWKFLKDMDAEGDYPEVFWELADQVVAGTAPEGYQDSLGC
ncbi:hypothetical protein [Cryptosporangium sp. NPDC048952]|uniref:hypothetical protein n=1 Tax=Cryptosporangium sp. NPDC048952 TaxID=3363961 RepID=UPI0037128299